MKILQVINNLGSGGAEKLISEIVPLMRDEGCHVEILLLKKKGSIYIEYLQQKGVVIHCLSEESLYSPILFFRLCDFFLNSTYDIIHVHIFPSLYWIALMKMCVCFKGKLIYTEHSTTNRRRNSIYFRILDKFVYLKYDKIICITKDVENQLIKHVGALNNKMLVVCNGVNLNNFNQAIQLKKSDLIVNYKPTFRFVTMIGRFSVAKDQKTVIRAIKLLPDYVHLLLIGDGPLRNECENFVIELDLIEKVHFLGVRKDVPDVLRVSDIGVLSSIWEGFGIAAVEAMAAGLPTIGSDVEGLSSVIGEAGLLFSQGDYKQLADCIGKLLSDPEYYETIARACKERSSFFTIEKMVSGYINIYNERMNES